MKTKDLIRLPKDPIRMELTWFIWYGIHCYISINNGNYSERINWNYVREKSISNTKFEAIIQIYSH